MKMFVCSIRDRQTEVFSRPMFMPSQGAAIRSFSDEVNRQAEDNPLCAHPEDYDLYKLGEFDDGLGKLEPCEFPELVVSASAVVR